jgi:YHS domain-containing protein
MKRAAIALVLIAVITMVSFSAFAQAKKTEKAKDPVCGIMVEKDPNLSVSHKGEVYYFCSKTDMEQFKKNPDKYAKK